MDLLLHHLRAGCILALLLCCLEARASTTNYFYAGTESHTVNGLCIGCSTQSPASAVDTGITSTYSTLKLTVSALGAYVSQRLTFSTTAVPNQDVYLLLESTTGSLLSVTALGGLDITSYKSGASNTDTKSSTSFTISLLSGSSTKYVIKVHETKSFDAVELKLKAGIASALTNLRVYSAWFTTVTLPVELAGFDGYSTPGTNVLRWSTASEINNAGFDVERSDDGENFAPIAYVAGSGNTNRMTTYQYRDENPAALSYYRLVQRDYDGHESTSPVISVEVDAAAVPGAAVHANPFNDQIIARYTSPHAATLDLDLYDINGRKVVASSVYVSEGVNELSMAGLSALPAGQYVLRMSNGTSTQQVRVAKL